MLKKLTLALLLCITFALSSQAITINGQPVVFVQDQKEKSFTFRFDEPEIVGILLNINGDNITVNGIGPSLEDQKQTFQELSAHPGLQKITVKNLTVKAPQGIDANGAIITTEEDAYFDTESEALLSNVIIASNKNIIFRAAKFFANNLFVSKAENVMFVPKRAPSWLKGISFDTHLQNQNLFSFAFFGDLDFTTGTNNFTKDGFITFGTNCINFHVMNPALLGK